MSAAEAQHWLVQGHGLRRAGRVEEALEALAKAARLAPADPRIALAYALLRFETWRPSAKHFAAAQALAPRDLFITQSHASALNAEGEPEAAQALLVAALQDQPGWIEGHRLLAVLRTTAGEGNRAARSFAEACTRMPGQQGLWLSWFHHEATARNWDKAAAILDAAEAALGDQRSLQMARLFLAAESGMAGDDPALFAPFADLGDPGLDLAQVRHALRHGRADAASAIAARHLKGPAARSFWPYQGLAWRLTGDKRAQWLDGDPPLIRRVDTLLPADERAQLADTLRALHIARAPYAEQSVRGGTQTDRHLFFNPDPVIQHARRAIDAAVQDYIRALPAPDPAHPLLGPDRAGPVLYEGSWSVRLAPQGFHSCHTHNRGWISAVLYVDAPDGADLGAPPAGHLGLGTPPPELGLNLASYDHVAPVPGRLVLFPSHMWHGTVPFDAGERLTIAFDVAIPPG